MDLLYLGGSVLVLLDLSYMSRFWYARKIGTKPCAVQRRAIYCCVLDHSACVCGRTQFESWVSCQKATRDGLVGASPAERRCVVRCLHNAPASCEQQLLTMWANKNAQEAHDVLAKPDVVLTNQKDKETMLPLLLKFDHAVAKCVRGLEVGELVA